VERLTRDAETVLERLELPTAGWTLSTGDYGIFGGENLTPRGLAAKQISYSEISSCFELRGLSGAPAANPLKRDGNRRPIRPHAERIGIGRGRTWIAIWKIINQGERR